MSFPKFARYAVPISLFFFSLTHSWPLSLIHYEGDQDLHIIRLAFSLEQGGLMLRQERWPQLFGQHVPFLKWSLAVC
jgi:hypothetical protein